MMYVLQEKRVLEYVAIGDFQTAVGFLLASNPDRSARYYRDALCTIALAVCFDHAGIDILLLTTTGQTEPQAALLVALQSASSGSQPAATPAAESVSRTLQIQAAKVVAAHAASVGDILIGVPLLCSAGFCCFSCISICCVSYQGRL